MHTANISCQWLSEVGSFIYYSPLNGKKRKKGINNTFFSAVERHGTNKPSDSFVTQSRKEKVGEMELEKGVYSGTSFN